MFGLKTTSSEFIDSINNINLIILHETWRHDNISSNCPSNYTELSLPSLKYSHIKNGRQSGEIIIWYKQEHHNYISPVKKGKTHIWLKISRGLLEHTKDVYFCVSIYHLQAPHIFQKNIFMNSRKKYFTSNRLALYCYVGISMPELERRKILLIQMVIII